LIFEARPNAAHLALAQLEARGILKGIITQNVDMLHSRAGSTIVHEIHGHLREVTCMRCYSIYSAAGSLDKFVASGEVPYCKACGGVLKPNVILIGEQLPVSVVNQARRQIKSCDLMLIAGSSLAMAPAGDLPLLALEHGARIVVINFEPTHIDSAADVVIRGDVVDVIPEITTKLLDQ
jgi:NAD-dependent deacetylase